MATPKLADFHAAERKLELDQALRDFHAAEQRLDEEVRAALPPGTRVGYQHGAYVHWATVASTQGGRVRVRADVGGSLHWIYAHRIKEVR